MKSTYIVTSSQDICRAKGVPPRSEVLSILESSSDLLHLSSPMSDNEFSSIVCILQENLPHLSTLDLQHFTFTSHSLNQLSTLFKCSSYLKKLKISWSSFPSPLLFKTLCSSLQSNTSLQHLDLSNNSLNDNHGVHVIDLIIHSRSLKEIVLDSNEFVESEFAQGFAVGKVEIISIDCNPLTPNAVSGILMATKINTNIRSLSIKGLKLGEAQEQVEGVIATALEGCRLMYLGFDLTLSSEKATKDIEKALVFYNKTLVLINSAWIDWGLIKEDHAAFNIKKALLANMWFCSGFDRNSVVADEIFREVQFLIIKKMKSINEYQDNPRTPQFKELTGKSLQELSKLGSFSGSFLFSDSSFVENKEKNDGILDEKAKFDTLVDVSETLNSKLEGFIKVVNERFLELEGARKGDDGKPSKVVDEALQKLRITEKKFQQLEEKIEIIDRNQAEVLEMYQNFKEFKEKYSKAECDEKSYEHHDEISGKDELNRLKKVEEAIKIISDIVSSANMPDSLKSLELKLDKTNFSLKSRLKHLSSSFVSTKEHELTLSSIASISSQISNVASTLDLSLSNSSKLEDSHNLLQKSFQTIQKTLRDNENLIKSLQQAASLADEKASNALKLKEFVKTRDSELFKKLADAECQILELDSKLKQPDFYVLVDKLQISQSKSEETLTKKIENLDKSFSSIKEFTLKLSEKCESLQKELWKLADLTAKATEISEDLSFSEFEPEKPRVPQTFNFSKTLSSRIERLEKISIHKKALDAQKTFEDEGFIPGDAENLVRSAVIEKANKFSSTSLNKFGYKSLTPFSLSHQGFSFEEWQPSNELKESLKRRGVVLSQFKE